MIIIQLSGGIGNQLFQYAVGRHLSLKYNTALKFDISHYLAVQQRKIELCHLNIPNFQIATAKELPYFKQKGKSRLRKAFYKLFPAFKYVKENSSLFNPSVLDCGDNCYLEGYWQCEKYFINNWPIIKEDLTFKESLSSNLLNLASEMENTNSVALHVRRGDYLNNPVHPVCPVTYYEKAINLIKEKVERPKFYVFSDDADWVYDNLILPENTTVITGNNGITDLNLMTYCKHNIIANSSFSWWGAYLSRYSEKIAIGPAMWFNENTRFVSNDIMPEGWIKI